MVQGDKVLITDIDGQVEVNTRLDDVYDDRTYMVIDKESWSKVIAQEIIEETKDNINIDVITMKVTEILDDGLKADLIDYVAYYLKDELGE